jgi:hypothetical protein
MRQNLHTGKIFLSISAKNSADLSTVYKFFEKESFVDTIAGLNNRFET